MTYLELEFMRSSKQANAPIRTLKKCNAITCIHNCNNFCVTYKDFKCDFQEEIKIPEQ